MYSAEKQDGDAPPPDAGKIIRLGIVAMGPITVAMSQIIFVSTTAAIKKAPTYTIL